MSSTKVTVVDYARDPVTELASISVRVWGHPTEALNHARRIGTVLLGNKPWKIIRFTGQVQGELPSDFVLACTMEQYDES